MLEPLAELRALLAGIRRRWRRRAFLLAWTLGAVAAAALLGVGWLAFRLVAGAGGALVLGAALAAAAAIAALVAALAPLRRPPSDRQIARFIEERAGNLDDVIATAVEAAEAAPTPDGVTLRLLRDAARAAREVTPERVVSSEAMRRAAAGAALGAVALLASSWLVAPFVARAADVVGVYLVPFGYTLSVTPGSVRVRAGASVEVTARVDGIEGGLVPTIIVGEGAEARSAPLLPGRSPGQFTIALNDVTVSFPYRVTIGAVRSASYEVRVVRPPRIVRIDVGYEYPKGAGLEPRTERDGGDILAPAGTRARLTIVADKPIRSAHLLFDDGVRWPVEGEGTELQAGLAVERDRSYRIALTDVDDLRNEGGTEYFIRVLTDRPPDVRIVRPAGDRQVSPIEEVLVEARADDDHGVSSLELVFQPPKGAAVRVPLPAGGQTTAGGGHTVLLEELGVQPGDVVAYHARARDIGRGRRPTESRSDMFFLEVKPYEQEFVAAESQASSGARPTGLEELIDAQKRIVAATWKLDARAERAGDARSIEDTRDVARAQRALRAKTEEAAGESAPEPAGPRRRRNAPPGIGRGSDEPLARAVEAMGRAEAELDRLRTAAALPHEMDALNQLTRAAAEIRRRQVARQQAQGGGGSSRETPDLSTLFDRELRRKQETNYETPASAGSRGQPDAPPDDPIDRIRELARRQEALAREERDLADERGRLGDDELTRRLERLSREQNDLRRQADELARQLRRQETRDQSGGASGQSSGGESARSSAEGARALGGAAGEMRGAESDLRRLDPRQASERAEEAARGLRAAERRLRAERPDEQRRAVNDLHLEARQIAGAERRIGREASQIPAGPAGDEARRRLAAEQERLADRAERLGRSLAEMTASPSEMADERRGVAQAASVMEHERIAERLRESAEALRAEGTPLGKGPRPDEVARALDRVAGPLGDAAGAREKETARLSEQLSRAQELRDRIASVERGLRDIERAGRGASPSPESKAEGQGGTGTGSRTADAERLQREAAGQMRDAMRLADEVTREFRGMAGGGTPEQWSRSLSSPGTETFKQDFARWDSLRQHLLAALDAAEVRLSDELAARANRERLNAGRHDRADEAYRESIDRYYRSLAAAGRPPR